jgi:hypothetical protein
MKSTTYSALQSGHYNVAQLALYSSNILLEAEAN